MVIGVLLRPRGSPRDHEMNTRALVLVKVKKVLALCGPFGPFYNYDVITRLHICFLLFLFQQLWLNVQL